MEEEKQSSLKIWKAIIFIIVLSQIFQTIHIYRIKEEVKQFKKEQLNVQKLNQDIFKQLYQNDYSIYQIITLLKEDNVKGVFNRKVR